MVTAAMDFGGEITATTITIEIETAGTTGVTLHGIDLRRDIAGVRVHKLGHSGAVASTFTNIPEDIYFPELSALAPDLALINFTINEVYGNVSPVVMIANIRTIIRRIREVRPYCDICLISPSDNAMEVNTYKFAEYENAIYQLSIDLKCAYFPSKTVIGVFGDMLHNVLTGDTVPHPNSAGGQLLGRTLVNELLTL
jgi:lysophospholipase L1-like esterase